MTSPNDTKSVINIASSDETTVAVEKTSIWKRPVRFVARHKKPFAIAGALAVGAAIGAVFAPKKDDDSDDFSELAFEELADYDTPVEDADYSVTND